MHRVLPDVATGKRAILRKRLFRLQEIPVNNFAILFFKVEAQRTIYNLFLYNN